MIVSSSNTVFINMNGKMGVFYFLNGRFAPKKDVALRAALSFAPGPCRRGKRGLPVRCVCIRTNIFIFIYIDR